LKANISSGLVNQRRALLGLSPGTLVDYTTLNCKFKRTLLCKYLGKISYNKLVGSYPKKEYISLTISLILAAILTTITKLHANNNKPAF
jgi:hypothetical protein